MMLNGKTTAGHNGYRQIHIMKNGTYCRSLSYKTGLNTPLDRTSGRT